MKDREIAISMAYNLFNDPNTVCLQAATTGVQSDAEVVAIAIVEPASGREILNSLVKPAKPYKLTDELKHGIAYSDLAESPAIHTLNVHALLDGKNVIVYGTKFFERLLRQSYAAHDQGFMPLCQWYCAMSLYGMFAQVLNERGPGYKYWKFEEVIRSLGIGTVRSHRVLEEARQIASIVESLADKYTGAESD
jgi:hypothetical protein